MQRAHCRPELFTFSLKAIHCIPQRSKGSVFLICMHNWHFVQQSLMQACICHAISNKLKICQLLSSQDLPAFYLPTVSPLFSLQQTPSESSPHHPIPLFKVNFKTTFAYILCLCPPSSSTLLTKSHRTKDHTPTSVSVTVYISGP
jgi:hypothetical protein